MNRLASTLAALTFTVSATLAQTPAPANTAIAPPTLPLLTSYIYWPVQFVQWVGTELPYSMLELDTDGDSKHPLLYITLTERVTGKRIHYTDNDGLLAAAKASGEEAHKTALAFEAAESEGMGSISTLRFTMANGKPLQWRFVQGSEISEQGSGLTPLPEAKLPMFLYREQAAVAGEGTALEIGGTVSTAEVWTAISHPPQFVAYRGAESKNAHTLIFLPGTQMWTVTSAPATLTTGATWELDEEHGNHRSIHVDKIEGAQVTMTSTDRFTPRVHCVMEGTRTGEGWSFNRVRFAPAHEGEKHFLAVQFATPLTSAADSTNLTLLAGKKPIGGGRLTGSGTAAARTETLSFVNPAWVSGKTMVEMVATDGGKVTVSAHP